MFKTAAFNNAALDYTAQINAAEVDFCKNLRNIRPVNDLVDKFARRYLDNAMQLVKQSMGSPLKSLMEIFTPINAALADFERTRGQVADETLAPAINTFFDKVQSELKTVTTGILESRDQIADFQNRIKAIDTDADYFLQSLERLVGKCPTGKEELQAEMFSAQKTMKRLLTSSQLQAKPFGNMLESHDQQVEMVAGIAATIEAQRGLLRDSVNAAATVREIVGSCVQGIKSPLSVRRKAVTFRAPQR